MARQQRKSAFAAAFVALASIFSSVVATDPDFCAKSNTGSGSTPDIWIWQSNGRCLETCGRTKFAYAITNYKNCWCSNYAPAAVADISKCTQGCPGTDLEKCGAEKNAFFSYMKVAGIKPSGTQGASSTESDEPSTTPKASTAVYTTSSGGSVIIITTIVTQAPDPSSGSDSSNSGLGTGGIVGVVVGIIGAILIISGAVLFFFMKKRKQDREDDYKNDPSLRASGSARRGAGSPSSPGSAGNRSSMLQIDPRMDPFNQGLYARSGSTESVNTLRDEHDYSRRIQAPKVLRATNPDPVAS